MRLRKWFVRPFAHIIHLCKYENRPLCAVAQADQPNDGFGQICKYSNMLIFFKKEWSMAKGGPARVRHEAPPPIQQGWGHPPLYSGEVRMTHPTSGRKDGKFCAASSWCQAETGFDNFCILGKKKSKMLQKNSLPRCTRAKSGLWGVSRTMRRKFHRVKLSRAT